MIVLELMHNGELKSVVTGMRPTYVYYYLTKSDYSRYH